MRLLFAAATALSTMLAMGVPAAAADKPPVFGYVGLYVKDVPRSLAFYEAAFGVPKRYITAKQEYGELDTGTTRLGFMNAELVERVSKNSAFGASDAPPSGSEIGFVTTDVAGLYRRAVAAGAVAVLAPAEKPWGQTVAYVRDPDGHLVEICSPLP
jgi:lactoylglutathione lyase